MPGVRVQHPTARNVRYTVVDARIPYPVPYQCTAPSLGGCGSVHTFKTHHLNLDETGAAIVSTGVYARIKGRLEADGFTLGGEVKRPPTIGIGTNPSKPGAWGDIPILGSPSNRQN